MKNIFIIFITIFLLFGCSNKTNINHNIPQSEHISQIDGDEEFEEFEEEEIIEDDPFESYNRFMSSFNDKAYVYVLNPVSRTYSSFVPKTIRKGIANMFKNLLFPVRLTNNLLQGKFKNSYDETARFLINSTIGVLGVFDVAKDKFNIKEHNEDFGQTLGFWGVGSGPHIVLPFLGPSNLRDMFSLPADWYLNPTVDSGDLPYKIPSNFIEGSLLYTTNMINKNSLNLGLYDSLKKDSMDFYTFQRDFYEQKRKNDIKE